MRFLGYTPLLLIALFTPTQSNAAVNLEDDSLYLILTGKYETQGPFGETRHLTLKLDGTFQLLSRASYDASIDTIEGRYKIDDGLIRLQSGIGLESRAAPSTLIPIRWVDQTILVSPQLIHVLAVEFSDSNMNAQEETTHKTDLQRWYYLRSGDGRESLPLPSPVHFTQIKGSVLSVGLNGTATAKITSDVTLQPGDWLSIFEGSYQGACLCARVERVERTTVFLRTDRSHPIDPGDEIVGLIHIEDKGRITLELSISRLTIPIRR